MIASPPLKNQEINQPSIFDLSQNPETVTESGFLSKAEDALLEEYVASADTSAVTTRKTIASIYILMIAKKGDRESRKYGSFNKLCESRAHIWGFSTSQCYRIGQASQQREKIRERAEVENWEIGDVDEIADSVFLEMERVEERFQQDVLEAAKLDFSKDGTVTAKSLEQAIDYVAEKYEDPAIVAKPKQKKSGSGNGGGESKKVIELQDMLVKAHQRQVELEEQLLSSQESEQLVAELQAQCEQLLNELDQVRASNQPNPDELDFLVNQRVETIRQQLEAEIRLDLQAQIAEAEALRARVAQLEEQLSKVAIDAPVEELITVVEQPEAEQFWRRKENLKAVSDENRLKAADADTAYIRCDNRSSEEQIQLSLERQAILEQDLAKHQLEQRRHSPTSPIWAMHQPLVDEIQDEIAFEQQTRVDLGYLEPTEVIAVEKSVEEIVIEDDEDAYTQITEDDLKEIARFLKTNGISNKEFISGCLTPRRYNRAGLITKQQLKEVWDEIEGMAELKPINEDELQEFLAFASEGGISEEDFKAVALTPFRYNSPSQILRCQLPELRKALEDIMDF
jgi:hypothetical protein